jgi:putative ABC transport system substrate-binding protein
VKVAANPWITTLVLFTLALVFVHTSQAQQTKIPRIGWLYTGFNDRDLRVSQSFLRRLSQFGYVEGKNITFEYRSANNRLDQLPALASELVGLKVDVLITVATPAAIAAKNATNAIPIVFILVADPVEAGLIDSLPRPGRNITGFTNVAAVLAGKRLELLKQIIPKLSRVAVLWDPQDFGSVQAWKESQLPARALRLQLHSLEVSSADKFESAFKDAIAARNSALSVTPNALARSNRTQVVELAARLRLPVIYFRDEFVDSGGLISYGADLDDQYNRAATYVDKILKGTKPADLPVEQPTKFELVINLKTAKEIGLTIPPNVLARADRVIK